MTNQKTQIEKIGDVIESTLEWLPIIATAGLVVFFFVAEATK